MTNNKKQLEKLAAIKESFTAATGFRADSINFLRTLDLTELEAVAGLVDALVIDGWELLQPEKSWEASFAVVYDFIKSDVDETVYILPQYVKLIKGGKIITVGGGSWQIFEGVNVSTTCKKKGKTITYQVMKVPFSLENKEENTPLFKAAALKLSAMLGGN